MSSASTPPFRRRRSAAPPDPADRPTVELRQEESLADPAEVLDTILALDAEGRSEPAGSLVRELAERLRGGGREVSAFQGPEAVRWAIARELAELPEDFPMPVRRLIAAAGRDRDPLRAVGELDELSQREPVVGLTAARRLTGTSLLERLYEPALVYGEASRVEAPVPHRRGARYHSWGLPIGLALACGSFLLLQLLGRSRAWERLAHVSPAERSSAMWQLVELDPELHRACDGFLRPKDAPCAWAWEILQSLDSGRCSKARSGIRILARTPAPGTGRPPDLARRLAASLAALYRQDCIPG